MSRIAIAGFQHETNSFAKSPADLAAFEMADSWPEMLIGEKVLSGTKGMNLPIAGFAEAARKAGHDLHPLLWCAAHPAAPVTDHAFETIAARILDGIAEAEPDAVYLDLHGAMITDSHDDGEGALLARLRDRFGADLPVGISLDMHANLSADIVAHTDVITIFRTYPHLDMAETGARCLAPLMQAVAGRPPAKAFRQAPFLISTHAQYTGAEPVAGLYAQAAASGVELAVGFTAGDTPHTGPSLVAMSATPQAAMKAADELYAALLAAEPVLDQPLPDADTAVRHALAMSGKRPIVLADVEDNAGGGGSSDTTGLLRAMVGQNVQKGLLGLLHDPEAAAAAHAGGEGAEISLALGGRSGCPGDAPFQGRFRVIALSPGTIQYEGAVYGGGTGQIGPSAALRVLDTGADVTVVVCTIRSQCLDRAHFRHLGLEPETAKLIGVKSTVHFRADFEPLAEAVLPVAVPGALESDLTRVAFQNLRDGVRLGPLGPAFSRKN